MANNPILALVQMIKGGGDPRPVFAQMMQQNPQVRQAMQLLEGKNQQQQLEMLRNMASERGVDLDELAGQLGLSLGDECSRECTPVQIKAFCKEENKNGQWFCNRLRHRAE